MVKHIVLFKYKNNADEKSLKELDREFKSLPKKISEILHFESGSDISVEGLAGGFTNGYVVTFENEAGRDTYLNHPDHKAFSALAAPLLADVLVFDYRTE